MTVGNVFADDFTVERAVNLVPSLVFPLATLHRVVDTSLDSEDVVDHILRISTDDDTTCGSLVKAVLSFITIRKFWCIRQPRNSETYFG